MFEFREPWFLALAILAIPLFIAMRRPIGRIRFSSLKIWPDKSNSFKARTAFIPPFLLSVAFIMFCIALAGPRISGGVVHKHKEGISIMLVIDKSGSMEALDMSREDKEQNRLEALKEVLDDFIPFVHHPFYVLHNEELWANMTQENKILLVKSIARVIQYSLTVCHRKTLARRPATNKRYVSEHIPVIVNVFI